MHLAQWAVGDTLTTPVSAQAGRSKESDEMTMKERISLFQEDSKILEKLANQHAESSKEYAALKRAAIALWYALAEGHESFQKYIDKFEGDLSPEQRAHLIEVGIDPDSDSPKAQR
jgi:hypothetical protein